jgi:hypothetical protein
VFKESITEDRNHSPIIEAEDELRKSLTKKLSVIDLHSAMKSGIQGIIKNKKKEFYFRGHLKEHNIDLGEH